MTKFLLTLVALVVLASPLVADDYEDDIAAAFAKAKTDSYPAATFSTVMPYEVGQWVLYGQIDDDGDKSLYKMSIVGKDNDTWILETWMMNEDDIIRMQMHVKGMAEAIAKKDVDDLEFSKIKMKNNDDDIVTIEGFVLDLSSGVYRDAMESWINQSTDFSDGGPITVPGGSFAGTTKSVSEVMIMGDEVEGTGYLHPAVPIYGMVKSTNDDGYQMILLDFGLTGAKSAF